MLYLIRGQQPPLYNVTLPSAPRGFIEWDAETETLESAQRRASELFPGWMQSERVWDSIDSAEEIIYLATHVDISNPREF